MQLTPLGRTAIIDGEIDTLTDVQWSGAASLLIFSIASLIVFIPTACCTSKDPRYWALKTFFGSSIGVGNDCAAKRQSCMNCNKTQLHPSLTMSHATLSILRWQICRTHCSLRRWVGAIASIQLHRALYHDFLANVPVGRKKQNGFVGLESSRSLFVTARLPQCVGNSSRRRFTSKHVTHMDSC